MKILIDAYNTATQNESGGVQVKIQQFYNELKKRGYDVTLYNKWEHKLIDYDVLHIFKASLDNYSLVHFAKKNNVPVVVSSIVPLIDNRKIKLSNYLERLRIHLPYTFLKKEMELADSVIAETLLEKSFIEKNYGISNVFVIPNGVTIDLDISKSNVLKERTGITGKYILQVGRFDSNKNQLSIIKAFRNTDIQVVFIGGPFADELKYYNECEKLATGNIHMLGWISHEDPLLSSAYLNAQVVILPSYKEIYGNSLIEGGAAGANLVATNVLPIKSWGLNDSCRTIDPHDIDSIKINVLEAYHSPKSTEIVDIIHENFSWNKVIEQHIEIYRSILRG